MAKNYIWSANGDDTLDALGDAILFPATSIKRIDPTSATTTTISIAAADGTADTDTIVLTHASGYNKEVMNAVVKVAQGARIKNGMSVMNDYYLEDAGGAETFEINQLDTSIAVTNVQYAAS
tara:strand:- start:833 stop:1198 length:366 start_codon:yes stop_codon:yes gene_type:complete